VISTDLARPASRGGPAVMADFRSRLFRHMRLQPLRFFTENRAGGLVLHSRL
jgi:hypothetical protein